MTAATVEQLNGWR